MKNLKKLLKIFVIGIVAILLIRAWIIRPRVDIKSLSEGLQFEMPVHMSQSPENLDVITVTEKAGKVKWFDRKDPKNKNGLVIDLVSKTHSSDWEAGMFSFTYDPDFKNNKFAYIFYSFEDGTNLKDRISRFHVDENMVADSKSEMVILEWKRWGEGHHGGQVIFKDGLLFASIGEASASVTKHEETLGGTTLLGTVIRIDVRGATAAQPYRVPADNPFVNDKTKRPEVWAYGFRNPWRWNFYLDTDKLIVGDVGESDREEISIVEKGKDYGWPHMEGDLCFPIKDQTCDKSKYELPKVAFDHKMSRSITAGLIYRGESLPWLVDRYIFADYLRGLYAVDFKTVPSIIKDFTDRNILVLLQKMIHTTGPSRGNTNSFVSIHENEKHEVYIVDLNGTIYELIPASFYYQVRGLLFQMLSFK